LNFKVDTHTHSIASGHAYSSIEEITIAAKSNGIEMFVLADHGSSMIGAPSIIYFRNLAVISRIINDIRVLAGVESNIINYDGVIDIDVKTCKRLDFIIASFHNICIEPSTIEEHTNAAIKAISNPYIDVIGHPGNPEFQMDIERFVLACKEFGKPVEINNHSFTARKGSGSNCLEILKLCKKHNVEMVFGSDAHLSFDVGVFNKIKEMLKSVDIPDELLLCRSKDSMGKYLIKRTERISKLTC